MKLPLIVSHLLFPLGVTMLVSGIAVRILDYYLGIDFGVNPLLLLIINMLILALSIPITIYGFYAKE